MVRRTVRFDDADARCADARYGARSGRPGFCEDAQLLADPALPARSRSATQNDRPLKRAKFNTLNRPGFPGGSGYWISTRGWSVRGAS
ncbi:hypothetical protein B8W69_28725 [Mycobacterium vulneris]|uniref:Uncharacterized protein n=1 Tax=Mycolicibacterium vulneris TaxID=547163 RepID=A0A1X2KI76_9MYCO|nr:hypothetical protein B8W69_28725 [Mycolicibacterium vulneris]